MKFIIMILFKKIQLLLILVCFLQLKSVNATVIEFNNDGTTTVHEALDYIQKQRRKKHPYVAKHYSKIPKNKNIYDKIITQMATKYKVDFNLIKAVIAIESSYNKNAVSPVGAQGLMQLMPMTAKRFSVSNSFDPKQNIEGGTKYLKFLLKLFDGDIELVLAAYNAGEGAVKKYNGIPPYRETKNYVPKVLNTYNSLKN